MFLMDNGRESPNDDVRELGKQFGVFIKHIASYAPWANDLNEWNHATVDIMMEKMIEDCLELSEKNCSSSHCINTKLPFIHTWFYTCTTCKTFSSQR